MSRTLLGIHYSNNTLELPVPVWNDCAYCQLSHTILSGSLVSQFLPPFYCQFPDSTNEAACCDALPAASCLWEFFQTAGGMNNIMWRQMNFIKQQSVIVDIIWNLYNFKGSSLSCRTVSLFRIEVIIASHWRDTFEGNICSLSCWRSVQCRLQRIYRSQVLYTETNGTPCIMSAAAQWNYTFHHPVAREMCCN